MCPAAAPAVAAMLAATALAVGVAVLAPDALANFITPKSGGSPNANQIASLYKIVLYIAAVVFVVVEGALVYSVFKFRAKKNRGRRADPRQHPARDRLDGRRRADPGGPHGRHVRQAAEHHQPAELLRQRPVLSASLTEPTPPNGKKLTICVQGRQFIWRYTYGASACNNSFATQASLLLPGDVRPGRRHRRARIQSTDVIHSWWMPSLGGKVDAVPGYTTYTWFKATKAGALYHGQCAQLCGRQHAFMTALVKVLTPAQYYGVAHPAASS